MLGEEKAVKPSKKYAAAIMDLSTLMHSTVVIIKQNKIFLTHERAQASSSEDKLASNQRMANN